MASEIDSLSAFVRVNNYETEPLRVSLRFGESRYDDPPRVLDFVNGSSIAVSTHVKPPDERMGGKTPINVKTIDGRKIQCQLPGGSVQDLEDEISRKTGYPRGGFRLGYGYNEMNAGSPLSQYGIQRNGTVNMMETPRCHRGGKEPPEMSKLLSEMRRESKKSFWNDFA